MTVRDERALAAASLELVPFDVEFDLARAVKSEAELDSVRDSVRINERGFEIFLESYAPGSRLPRSWPRPRSGSSRRAAGGSR